MNTSLVVYKPCTSILYIIDDVHGKDNDKDDLDKDSGECLISKKMVNSNHVDFIFNYGSHFHAMP